MSVLGVRNVTTNSGYKTASTITVEFVIQKSPNESIEVIKELYDILYGGDVELISAKKASLSMAKEEE